MKFQFSIILLMIACLCNAQSFSEEDVLRLKLYCTGDFKSDTSEWKTYGLRKLMVKPFWEKRKDGAWLLVAETLRQKNDTSGHFYVWHFYRESNSILLLQLLQFKDVAIAKEIIGGTRKDKNVFLQDLKNMVGCELYIARDNSNNYSGKSKGKDCYIDTMNTEYFLYEAVFKKNELSWGAKGFDKNDKQIVGSAKGNNYLRIVTPIKK
jgi:hypothetical protein